MKNQNEPNDVMAAALKNDYQYQKTTKNKKAGS